MKKSYRVISIWLVLLLVFVPLLSSCNKSSNTEIILYSNKGDMDAAYKKVAEEYQKATGQKVKVITKKEGDDNYADQLRVAMTSEEKPTIFAVPTVVELVEWVNGGYAYDFDSNSLESKFKDYVKTIPDKFKFTIFDNKGSYGIPFGVEGYGLVASKKRIASIVGENNVADFTKDFKAASYAEFEAAVKALQNYFKNNAAGTITLNGNQYDLLKTKNDTAKKLQGVFSVAANAEWTYCDHLMNIASATQFKSSLEALNAKEDKVDSCLGSFKAFAKTLDLMSSNANLPRNKDFINETKSSYDVVTKDFAEGKTLFIKQGNWITESVQKYTNTDDLIILPTKMDFSQEDISVEGLTPEKINSSIPVFIPGYYVINAKCSKEEIKAAQDFLTWFNTSEKGRELMLKDLKYNPWDVKSEELAKVSNVLGREVLSYQKSGNMIPGIFAGTDKNWRKKVGEYIKTTYMTKETWEVPADYDNIANEMVKIGKEKS